jgi:hypothetical protein
MDGVQLMLVAGGDVHVKNKFGDNAMSIASWARDSWSDKLLALSGANIISRNYNVVTPLQSTACLDCPSNSQALLDLGAILTLLIQRRHCFVRNHLQSALSHECLLNHKIDSHITMRRVIAFSTLLHCRQRKYDTTY